MTWCPICWQDAPPDGCFNEPPTAREGAGIVGDERNGPGGAGNTNRGLTSRSTSTLPKELLAMANPTNRPESPASREPLTIAQVLAKAAQGDSGALGDIARAAGVR